MPCQTAGALILPEIVVIVVVVAAVSVVIGLLIMPCPLKCVHNALGTGNCCSRAESSPTAGRRCLRCWLQLPQSRNA